MLSITPYGRSTFLACIVIGLALLAVAFLFSAPVLRIGVGAVALVFMGLAANFFRDPERVTPQGDGLVISPADGKVVSIERTEEPAYLKGRAVKVSIFMSPLDVHVNRFPISGTVGYVDRIDGKFTAAFHDKSAEENQRTLIGIENGRTKLLFKQITGAVARRIVADVSVGQKAQAGARFGMIKFGSRVDVLMPEDSEVVVALNDRTVAGSTVIARLGERRAA
jgi:phosphatidylserine decarboxylase